MYKISDKTFVEQGFEWEKFLLAGILNYPNLYEDLDNLIITSSDFNSRIHQDIWVYFGEVLKKNGKVDYKILGLKMMELKLSYGMELTPLDYLEAISHIKVEEESVKHYAAKLKTLSIRKQVIETHIGIANDMLDFKNDLTHEEIVNLVDIKANSQTNLFAQGINEPIDVYKGLREEIEEQGNSEKEYGITCHFPILRAQYGDFYPGDLYVWASRQKQGKSTLIMEMLDACCNNLSQNVIGLYIDTELSTKRFRWRIMSRLTGINENYFRKGSWRKNAQWVELVRNTWPKVELFFNRIQHLYVANMPIEEVIAIIRRWHRKNVRSSDKEAIIVYDYIKINSDLITNRYNRMQGHDLAGYKADSLKKLAEEISCPIMTSVQTNRGNASKKLDKREDDTTVISLSDQIGMYCSNMFLFNKLLVEEFQDLQGRYGLDATHRLIPLVTRVQGDEAPGFNNLVKVENEEGEVAWKENEIYFKFENFRVTELTDLATLANARKDYGLNPGGKDGEMLE
jgi:replicative DNA helicase